MWNKRKEEDYDLKSSPAAPPPAPSREAMPVSPMPSRVTADHEPGRGAASFGKSVVVKGQIYSREDLYLDGEMEGTVELQDHRLTVGPNARLKASIKAREVVVLGNVNGDIEVTDKIDIRKNAKVIGDIKTARIAIEDGAFVKGSVDIVKQEPAKPSAQARAQSAPSAQPINAMPVGAATSGPAAVLAEPKRQRE
jgi:cytoskeletal protein CcmA (bactofilin family)